MWHISVRIGKESRLKQMGRIMEHEGLTQEVRIATPPQRIERKCYPKAQIGNLLLTKSAACAQKWTTDDWESSRRHAIITVRCNYASKKTGQNGIVEKNDWIFLSISVPPQRNQRKKCARHIFEGDEDIYITRNRIKTTMEWEYPPAPPDTLRKKSIIIVMRSDCYCVYCCLIVIDT